MSKPPLISVLITTYNCEYFLKATLDSLLNQTFEDFEIIIVEDGSDDSTPEILKKMAEFDNRIKPFFPGRLGRAKALNYGLAHCKGQYLAINDADDLSKPNRFEKQIEFLDEHSEVGLLGTGKEVHQGEKKWVSEIPVTDKEIRRHFVKGQPIQHSSVMFRKEVVDKVGGYNEDIEFLLDRDIFLRVAEHTKMYQINEPLITLNRSDKQFFIHKFKGFERTRMSARYQLMAVDQFGFTPWLKLEIIAKLWYRAVLELKNRLLKK